MIERILDEEGIPPEMLYLAQVESAFRPEAISRSGARGMWQFIPARGEEYGLRRSFWIDERSDPEKSTRAAARHLRDLFGEFGDWYLAMAAYNSGPARVERAIEEARSRNFWVLASRGTLPAETANYVPTVVAMAIIASDPAAWGFDVVPLASRETTRIPVAQATDLRIISERLDMPIEDLQALNPQVLQWATPPADDEFELILPAGYDTRFLAEVAPLPESERLLFRHHLVAAGETLSGIALDNAVSVDAIVEANGLRDPNALGIGQSLRIPPSSTGRPDPLLVAGVPGGGGPPDHYEIQPGDTLSTLAGRFGVSPGDIRSWNAMASDILIAGAKLRLSPVAAEEDRPPESGRPFATVLYDVRPGDTLWSIARAYRTSVEGIRERNLDSDLSVIRPGDAIVVPDPAGRGAGDVE